jgi:hypothetical protein
MVVVRLEISKISITGRWRVGTETAAVPDQSKNTTTTTLMTQRYESEIRT